MERIQMMPQGMIYDVARMTDEQRLKLRRSDFGN